MEYLREPGRTAENDPAVWFGICPCFPVCFGRFSHGQGVYFPRNYPGKRRICFPQRAAGGSFFFRVMFPIIDLRGNVVGFGGRVLTQEKPKYLNTSDTIVFKKSQGLFAMNFAKEACREQLILAEGYMDVIALHQAGFPNAAAALGTAFTGEQARLLTRYTKEVVLSYDADEAGQKAAARAIQLLREVGMPVRVLSHSQRQGSR